MSYAPLHMSENQVNYGSCSSPDLLRVTAHDDSSALINSKVTISFLTCKDERMNISTCIANQYVSRPSDLWWALVIVP